MHCDEKIRVLLVEDNLVVQKYLSSALATDAEINLLALANDGLDAVKKAIELKPNLILLDLMLPKMDGIDVIQRVMHQAPCPIVVISSELDRKDRDLPFEAQRAGAVDILAKPFGMDFDSFQEFSENLCRTVRTMSKIKVTRRWFFEKVKKGSDPADYDLDFAVLGLPRLEIKSGLLVIGSSTGGPSALYEIVSHLPEHFQFSVLIAQHITEGFSETLASWLSKTGNEVRIPKDGEPIEIGGIYLAADGCHLVIGPDKCLHQVRDSRPRYTPSIDMLYESVEENYSGKVCAMILTGMGDDGARGMEKLFRSDVLTIAEAEESCVIFGMPKVAINSGAVKSILSLGDICRVVEQAVY